MAMARLFLCVDVHPTREFHEFSGVRPAYGKWPGTSRSKGSACRSRCFFNLGEAGVTYACVSCLAAVTLCVCVICAR